MDFKPVIRLGIAGYGRLGRSLADAITNSDDLELAFIISRRDKERLGAAPEGVPVIRQDEAMRRGGEVDILLSSVGSMGDAERMAEEYIKEFNLIDSFDIHNRLAGHIKRIDGIARERGRLAILGVGWDPGLLSILRVYATFMSEGTQVTTLWGPGISQGHSNALRVIEGVRDAVEITVPKGIQDVESRGEGGVVNSSLHKRVCYIEAEEGADKGRIFDTVVGMPDYFLGYETEIHFVCGEEIERRKADMSHRARVVAKGGSDGADYSLDLSLLLGSNPRFTASIMLAYARAAHRLILLGEVGARSALDIPPSLLTDGYSLL